MSDLSAQLRTFYDNEARDRRDRGVAEWKVAQRAAFGVRLGEASSSARILELGAGPGRDGEFFAGRGLDVVCIDISPAMVQCCLDRGLRAQVPHFVCNACAHTHAHTHFLDNSFGELQHTHTQTHTQIHTHTHTCMLR